MKVCCNVISPTDLGGNTVVRSVVDNEGNVWLYQVDAKRRASEDIQYHVRVNYCPMCGKASKVALPWRVIVGFDGAHWAGSLIKQHLRCQHCRALFNVITSKQPAPLLAEFCDDCMRLAVSILQQKENK
jgi:hypothetical protein